ncbi:MAG: ATP-binding protein [Tepidibacter sp.]|uniref:ATP-binding protein n=1 Tax=Tepidibacter sp. TaxID=2529387 RepID=UPI0025F05FF0|nr:ATP-binding protein [Tepidibacter sp.]MCT4507916.1 ATP-binding protein [Tepidibacter sp.]
MKNLTDSSKNREYDCPKCKDREMIYNPKLDAMVFCECRERKEYERILENSRISEAFRQKTLKDYKVTNGVTRKARGMAFDYATEFNGEGSIGFLGQVGAGKTHLSIAIANALMSRNIGVLYMQYREAITALKQNMLDEYYYQREISKYKNATVLLIDDLFKGKITETDINIMFEIINYRYLKGSPMIVSSEYTSDKLLNIDEAIGSRIIEQCDGRMIEFIGKSFNHRLNKRAI